MSDESTQFLLDRVRRGDRTSLEALYRRYMPRVLAAVRMRLGSELRTRVESWDILQEVMVESLKTVQDFDPANEGALMAWLGKIALNRIRDAHDFHRAQKRDMRNEQSLALARSDDASIPLSTEKTSTPSPSALVVLTEDVLRLEEAMDGLPKEDRELIVARKIEEQSLAQIGRDRNLTADAARMRVNRAMARLVQVFQELGAPE